MRVAFRERPWDLVVVLSFGIALLPSVAVTGAVRIALGLVFDLFLPGYALVAKALTVALVASIAVAAGTLAYVVATPRPGERFTEFYVLDRNGTANDYPSRLNVSENAAVILGVVNHEFATVNYTVEARL